MRFLFKSALALFSMAGLAEATSAALIVNPAQPITKHVEVQLIQTALDNGTSPATVFGNATQQATIEAGIDTIWAQAGIGVDFLPTVTRYNSTFAYQGTAGTGTRPQGDLNTIISNARAASVLNSDPQVIDMFLVNVVPAFGPLSESYAAGLSFIGGNGVVGFTGDSLLTFGAGLDVISGVFAHELGHNLGLSHTATGDANLMSPSSTSYQLDASQIATARASIFARSFTAPIAGDYGGNGIVDASDYVKWRNMLNQTGSGLAADGNGNGVIDAGDYIVWRSHFGSTTGSGASTPLVNGTVPEPTTAIYAMSLLFLCARRSGSSRG
jgi:hypothetical protein